MTYNEAYRKGIQVLKDANISSPATDAGVLLCHVMRCDKTYLFAHGDRVAGEDLLKTYFSLLERRSAGCPLQYLTGMQEFMSLMFEVGPEVLIPRQETELLVETVIRFCKGPAESSRDGALPEESSGSGSCPENAERHVSILDIGTGSGCIAVSLARYIPGCRVTAVDIMPAALEVARKNALANGVADRVRFIKSNLFENIPEEKFDVIVSNPPYVKTGDINKLQREIGEYEPISALDGGPDGLFFYREIIKSSQAYLRAGGMLAFETGHGQAPDVVRLLSGGVFKNIEVYKDLSGIERVVTFILFPAAP
ncbi:MAG: peptide chain release factor N(5)-glutamine methyltransferase [Bacillota bacterium]